MEQSSETASSKNLYDEKGISKNFSSPCTPEQNGVAERRNRTLIEAAKTMLNSTNLPKQFWGEDVNNACYTRNSCHVHIHSHKVHLGKFDEKADDGLFLGYSPMAKAFRVFNIIRQEQEETYHVTFSEDDEAISKSST
ncbi:retrovirus-related pol polyprotein from transposon TNT 1-94 [Tanacetum coccineum]